MRVSIQFDLDAARELHRMRNDVPARLDVGRRGPTASNSSPVSSASPWRQYTPGKPTNLLAPFFYVEVPDGPTAEHVAKRFRQADGVEGAWVRPSDESV